MIQYLPQDDAITLFLLYCWGFKLCELLTIL